MEATITKKLLNTQERRWEHVLDGYVLIADNGKSEHIIGMFKGQLYNFTLGQHSPYTLNETLDLCEFKIEMKDSKIRRFLYTYGFVENVSYKFMSDMELTELKKKSPGVNFTKHENAWLEN